jgi:hypothetical protein
MKIDTSVALKAGLIGAGAGVVAGLAVGAIPFLFCLAWWIPLLIGLLTGALYVYLTPGKEDIAGGAIGGAVTGAIAGLASALATNLLTLLLHDGTIFGLFLGLGGGIVTGAVLGAIGGAIYAAIKK